MVESCTVQKHYYDRSDQVDDLFTKRTCTWIDVSERLRALCAWSLDEVRINHNNEKRSYSVTFLR